MMELKLENAQNTPHLNLVEEGVIRAQVYFCRDGVLINGKKLKDYPKSDGIPIYTKGGRDGTSNNS